MLFDDEEQVEVRHVISLAHHDIGVYSGGDLTPEGELFIKRNALCLSRKQDSPELGPDSQLSKPFYLFSENCSAKEDFYFALLRNQQQTFGLEDKPPNATQFEVKNILSLVQKLHSSEDNIHSRWLNAMIGRIFLGIHRTQDLENYICEKITKKISRVKRPSFLTNIAIRRIDTGEAAPYFTNMKLKDLTVEGECVVEADVRYTGNFRLEVSATAKIDLGPRFKAREVNLVLAVVLKRIEGHVLFKIKPPPSNRVWFSFQTMPKMEMNIEPIVSTRQITYTVILRQIENRIKEVLAETLVQPFWDDVPFFRTEHKKWRGGIFETDNAAPESEDLRQTLSQAGNVDTIEQMEENPDVLSVTRPMEKSQSMPIVENQPVATGLFGRKLRRPGTNSSASASSTSVDASSASPSVARSPNFHATTPEPVIGTDTAHAELFKPSSSPPDHASNYMAALQSRSDDASPAMTPSGSPPKPSSLLHTVSSSSSLKEDKIAATDEVENFAPERPERHKTASSAESGEPEPGVRLQFPPTLRANSIKSQPGSLGRSFLARRENLSSTSIPRSMNGDGDAKRNTLSAVTNAAVQARQWGWNAIQKQREARKNGGDNTSQLDLSQPMGRGQPLPPPGVPLPRPTNGKTKAVPVATSKRKPVPPPRLPDRPAPESQDSHPKAAPPPLPSRRRRDDFQDDEQDEGQNMLVVAAPDDSQPSSPISEDHTEYVAPWVEDATVEDAAVDESTATPVPGPVDAVDPTTDAGLAHISDQPKLASPIVAMPAPDPSGEEDDDDYSGWIEQEEVPEMLDQESPQDALSQELSTLQEAPAPEYATQDVAPIEEAKHDTVPAA